ncbi:hypothetical protein GCM10017643_47740 [Ancylobacter dichloromethanicus]|uniref:Uncharacterized protein n=1 Tax=Ancylobacter dichloromethanicus TaxID=518825 RepID=A0A9W6JBR8_9HYPH|nr:hypothetical protein GCM10017643_47740 [Ancylobacter dichloromethanicus]
MALGALRYKLTVSEHFAGRRRLRFSFFMDEPSYGAGAFRVLAGLWLAGL